MRRELSNPRGRPNQRDMSITDGKPRAAYFERRSKAGNVAQATRSADLALHEVEAWRHAAFHRLLFIIAQNGLWLCAAMAGQTRPARSLGAGKRLAGRLRGAGDKRQETYDTGGGDGHDRYAQRPLQQQPS